MTYFTRCHLPAVYLLVRSTCFMYHIFSRCQYKHHMLLHASTSIIMLVQACNDLSICQYRHVILAYASTGITSQHLLVQASHLMHHMSITLTRYLTSYVSASKLGLTLSYILCEVRYIYIYIILATYNDGVVMITMCSVNRKVSLTQWMKCSYMIPQLMRKTMLRMTTENQ